MPRFFIEPTEEKEIIINGEDARHIAKTLRMGPGEGVTLCDGQGKDYACEIERITDNAVILCVQAVAQNTSEPSVHLTLYQALPKGDKMEMIIQKAVELGVSRVIPVLTSRCVSRPDDKSAKKKIERWQKIATEAAKQCGRGKIPKIEPVMSFETALQQADQQARLLFYERGGQAVEQLLGRETTSVAIVVGAEGGFEQKEVELAGRYGFFPVGLGPRILRCETAPLTAASIVMYLTGNMQ